MHIIFKNIFRNFIKILDHLMKLKINFNLVIIWEIY